MIFLHYLNDNNLGDRLSCPRHYFPEFRFHPVCELFSATPYLAITDGPIVIGGGGILCDRSENYFTHLFDTKRPCVIWGAGINTNGGRCDLSVLSRYVLVGLRDYGGGYDYVPDVSCLHPALRLRGNPANDFMVYEHFSHPIAIDAPIRLNNSDYCLSDVVRAMLSVRCVITNSYHGCYWAMLLNRRVLLFGPLNDRFKHLRHFPPVVDQGNWKKQVAGDPVSPVDFMEECVQLNLEFFKKVHEKL